ncbi:MAG: C1 family peptidase [Armatimonadetes bacterium]|nr:C1 family peptidase [Armatimonadota bacterium]
MVNALQRSFESDARNRLALNAVTKTSLHDVAKSRRTVTANDHTFSHVLKTGEATSQNKTGRCWLFAGLNPLRGAAIKQMNLDDKFELSQNYLMFWDKLEKANYFLENMIETVKEPVGSRLLDWLLMAPIQDGGQWDMFVNLLKKYGVVPKAVMPETQSSSESRLMNGLITTKLREDACRLREMHAQGAKKPELRAAKENMVEIVYRMLAIHLGEPPEKFLWQWRDKDGEFHRDGIITPQEFLKRHVPSDLESMICMIHCPQKSKRYDTLYTIRYLGNVVDGDIIRYLNVDMPVLKKAAVKMLMDGETVWFGCDVGKMLDRDLGILDIDLYDYDLVYGTTFNFDKAQRLDYGQSQMNHAMVFTGVDLDDKGNPRKWRVENSWGDKIGDKGFLVMSDGWFDEYVYEVAVNRKYIAPKLRSVLKKKPVPLPPWDPMGALAKGE